MSDFTINDTMAELRYELDEREIYNDIRSDIGVLQTEVIIDADPTYAWYHITVERRVPAGWTYFYTFPRRHDSASDWEIVEHSAWYSDVDANHLPYFDYSISALKDIFVVRDGSNWTQAKYVDIENTGSQTMYLSVHVKYKYLATEGASHEETKAVRLNVRATDSTSIAKYGRRVMNLVWQEGTSAADMQTLVDYYLARHKDPYGRVTARLIGKIDAMRTQIFTREISDLITVVCDNLGLNADHYIDSIAITDGHEGIPIGTWGLEIQRTEEALSVFTVDVSLVGSTHIIGS